MLRLIVGLGNPGREYSGTRHNVGFEVVDGLARRCHTRIMKRLGRASTARIKANDSEILIAKPQTFMNLSGEAVGYIARRERIDPSEILVVYDDMALPLGKIRIRPSGSAGGHNGMRSIIGHLRTDEFPRLRIGIGSARGEAVDHVLSRFRRAEIPIIRESVQNAIDAIEAILAEGVEPAMNKFNNSERRSS